MDDDNNNNNTDNKCPEWLVDLMETRVVYEGRVLFGETIVEIVDEDEK